MAVQVQGFETLYRTTGNLPWVPFEPYNERVGVKLLKVDPVSGQAVALLRVPGGENIGVHYHHRTVIVYTTRGAWRYAEHDWVSRAGDLVYETAGSQHTFIAEPGDDVEAFIVLEGALQFLGPNGETVGIENWKTFLQRYSAYCERKGVEIVDLKRF